MNIREFFTEFVIAFAAALGVAVIVTYLWNLIARGAGAFDWETSFRLAIIFGIVLPLVAAYERKKRTT